MHTHTNHQRWYANNEAPVVSQPSVPVREAQICSSDLLLFWPLIPRESKDQHKDNYVASQLCCWSLFSCGNNAYKRFHFGALCVMSPTPTL